MSLDYLNIPLSTTILLSTERLYLRRFTMDDAPLLHALDNDPEVMRYISKGQPTALDVITNRILPTWLAYYEQTPPQGYWAVHEQATDAFIGWFHLRPQRSEPFDMELGYRLRQASWGHGYATEGGRALLQWAFTHGGIERVVATTLIENKASQRVMEKCGLRFEKHFIYPLDLLPTWTAEERRAVLYCATAATFAECIPAKK